MKNRLLYVGGAVVALLLVGLLWAVRSGSGKATTPPVASAAADATPGLAPAAPAANPPPASPADAAPAAAAPAAPIESTAPATDGEPARIVHDHTGEAPPAHGSPFTPDTVFAVRQALAPLVETCAEPLVRAGSSGTLTIVAKFDVASGKIKATPTAVSHTQFKDAAFDACVQKAISEAAFDAPSGQSDASYRLAIPFKFP